MHSVLLVLILTVVQGQMCFVFDINSGVQAVVLVLILTVSNV